ALEPLQGGVVDDTEVVRVVVTVPDFSQLTIQELTTLSLIELRKRLPEAVVAEIEDNNDEAFAEAIKLQEAEAVDAAFGIDAETSTEVGVEPEAVERSYLADFYAQLLGYQRKVVEWPEEGPLREVLYSILKPAIIVDGQHRVFGGATADHD